MAVSPQWAQRSRSGARRLRRVPCSAWLERVAVRMLPKALDDSNGLGFRWAEFIRFNLEFPLSNLCEQSVKENPERLLSACDIGVNQGELISLEQTEINVANVDFIPERHGRYVVTLNLGF